MHRQFGDAVELFLPDVDIAQPLRQAERGDQPEDDLGGGVARPPERGADQRLTLGIDRM